MKLKNKAYLLIAKSRQFFFLQPVNLRTIQYHRTCSRLIQCSHYLKQRRFSGSAGSHNTDYFAFSYQQIYSFQHLQRAKALGYST